jgi:glucose/mannose-6-phosphate isomerase
MDSLDEVDRYDRGGMLDLTSRFDRQLETALEIARSAVFPSTPRIERVALLGMGGSAIGGDLVRAWLGPQLTVPFSVIRGYLAPPWVNAATLCIASSYSGNTEETLEALQDVRSRGAWCACITSGGELERIARREEFPLFPFPGGQPPRTALPFSFVGVLWVLAGAGLIEPPWAQVEGSLDWVRNRLRLLGPETSTRDNPAKLLAQDLTGRIPVIYGSSGRCALLAKRWASQFSENAKVLAYSAELPEMNHNEIVGWEHPREVLAGLSPIFLRDHEDHPRVQIRMEITREILSSRAAPVLEYWSAGSGWLERLWSLVLLGDFASIYLALLNREDPTPVEAIESLKMRLKQY